MFWFPCLLIFLMPVFAFAQNVRPGPSFHHLTTDNGLPSSEVYEIHQDRNGYFWFGTDNGASRYDGYEFENFGASEGLTSNVVLHFFEDWKGRIWMNTLLGDLFYFENDRIYPYRYNHIIQTYKTNFIAPGDMYIDQEENLFLVISGLGVLKINQFGEDELFTGKLSSSIIVEVDNMALISNCYLNRSDERKAFLEEVVKGDQINIISFFNGKKMIETWHPSEQGPNGRTTEVFMVSSNEFLVWNRCQLYYFKDYNLIWNRPASCAFSFMSSTADGEIFMSESNGRGARMYKNIDAVRDDQFEFFLPEYSIADVFKDRQGIYWFSTLENGIFYTDNFQIQVYDKAAGLTNQNIGSISIKNENEIFFSDRNDSIFQLNAQQKSLQKIPDAKQSTPIFSIFYDAQNQRLWSGAFPYRFFEFTTNKWVNIVRQIPNDNTSFQTTGPKKTKVSRNRKYLWGNYYNGFQKFSLDDGTLLFQSEDFGFSERAFVTFESIENELWIGTGQGLLHVKEDEIEQINQIQPDIGIRVEDIAQLPDTTLVIGTKGAGLFLMKDSCQFQLTTNDGLTSNMIEHIETAPDGTIWVGTLNGLNKIEIDAGADQAHIRQFTKSHGLPSGEINDLVLTDSTLWIATSAGLVQFPTKVVETTCSPHYVILDAFKVNGENTPLKNAYTLAYNENTLQLDYITLNYILDEPITYRYRLTQLAPWIETKSRTANFINLPFGKYTFEVQAKNENGVWSPSLFLPFVISRPFWLRTEFLLFFALLLVAIIWLLVHLYIRRIRKRAVFEQQISELKTSALQAQMNPHFVFNCLNAIQSFIASEESERATRYLAKFALLVRNNLNASTNPLISLEEEIQTIHNYLSLEKMRFSKRFEYEVEVQEGLDILNIDIPPLLTLPYVENAVIHGILNSPHPGRLHVRYGREDGFVFAEIEDNGLGIFQTKNLKIRSKQAAIHKSVGMSISKKRLEIFNGGKLTQEDLIIQEKTDTSGNVTGTLIRLRLRPANNYKNKTGPS